MKGPSRTMAGGILTTTTTCRYNNPVPSHVLFLWAPRIGLQRSQVKHALGPTGLVENPGGGWGLMERPHP